MQDGSNVDGDAIAADAVREKLRAFLARSNQAAVVTDDDNIFAAGLVNSLFAMQLVCWVEREFSLEIPTEELVLRNFSSVAAISALVSRLRPSLNAETP